MDSGTKEWVVVFLRVDGPQVLKDFDTEEEAQEYERAIYNGEVDEFSYLKESLRLRYWRRAAQEKVERGEERVMLATQVDVPIEDMDPNSYY